MSTLREGPRGRFITFEGGEGAGKSTQIRRLAERLAEAGVDVLVTREPGGTPLANAIRALLVSKAATKSAPMFLEMFETLDLVAGAPEDAAALEAFNALFTALGAPIDPRAEALLHYAARADHWGQAIKPMLDQGRWMLCDRFADSTAAYQGAASGLGQEVIDAIRAAALPHVSPDLTVLLDIEPREGLERAKLSRGDTSRYEDKDLDYHERVRAQFLHIARTEPDRVVIVDAAAPLEEVEEAVWRAAAPLVTAAPV